MGRLPPVLIVDRGVVLSPEKHGFPVYSAGPANTVRLQMKKRSSAKPLSTNKHLLRWVEKMVELCQPAQVHWVDGSQGEYDALCAEMVAGGTLIKLNQKLWPGCY